jgi:hypothetical protein
LLSEGDWYYLTPGPFPNGKGSLLAEWMLELHERNPRTPHPSGKKHLQREIESTDKEIDALVYELYGLTEEEIRIVEGGG